MRNSKSKQLPMVSLQWLTQTQPTLVDHFRHELKYPFKKKEAPYKGATSNNSKLFLKLNRFASNYLCIILSLYSSLNLQNFLKD